MIKVQDNFLTEDELNALQDVLLGHDFPWYFNNRTTLAGENDLNDFQMIHAFYLDGKNFGFIHSEYFKHIEPLLEKLGGKVLIRAKANLRTIAPKPHMVTGYHSDCALNCDTSIFYVNSNNGYTLFEKTQEKIQAIENRMITFSSHLKHCGVSCTDQSKRVVINFNLIKGN